MEASLDNHDQILKFSDRLPVHMMNKKFNVYPGGMDVAVKIFNRTSVKVKGGEIDFENTAGCLLQVSSDMLLIIGEKVEFWRVSCFKACDWSILLKIDTFILPNFFLRELFHS